MKRIIVIGGGTGGAVVANGLARHLKKEIRKGEVSVTVFDGAKFHEFQPAYLAVAFHGSNENAIRRPTSSLLSSSVRLVDENCSKIDLANKFVVGERSGKRSDFEYAAIAVGCIPDPSQIPGLSEANLDFHTSNHAKKIFDRISKFQGGKIVTGIAGLPYKCPPSPNESTFLLHEFFTKRGMREKVGLCFITPYLRPYPAEPMSEVIEPLYKERKIETLLGFNVESVDPIRKIVYSMEGESVSYDELFLVPPHITPDVIRRSEFSDSDGWVIANKRDLHVKDYDYAFAIGDNTNLPISKAGVEAHLEGVVVANNIAAEIKGTSERYLFTGRFQCTMETGFRKATFVVGTYDKPVKKIRPSFTNYVQKKIMAKIYWNAELGRCEWLFRMNFGRDYYDTISNGKTAAPAMSPMGQ
ncbi:MAG: FAD-dependent oxidoreductase [Thaumarchaeota archaeon]|nr:FAD-dependent oxidoreductase [Nitrososphaerota archaeon]